MSSKEAFLKFATTLSGIFDNFEQSQQNPKDFARINIIFRPLPWHVFNGPGFYSEQHYDYAPWEPYRQGVHRLIQQDDLFIMYNYGFANPERIAGAGRNPELLNSLDINSIKQRCGCAMHFKTIHMGHYVGSVEPGKQCFVPRDGRMTYLVSEVEVDQNNWISRDRGFDPETDQQCWGSEHGHLRFKRNSYLDEIINEDWIKQST